MKRFDISSDPELVRLVEEVRASRQPRLLELHSKEVAILAPVKEAPRPRSRRKTNADYQAFLSSLGSWKDFDGDAFLAGNEESRRWSSRPPVEL